MYGTRLYCDFAHSWNVSESRSGEAVGLGFVYPFTSLFRYVIFPDDTELAAAMLGGGKERMEGRLCTGAVQRGAAIGALQSYVRRRWNCFLRTEGLRQRSFAGRFCPR